VAQNCYEPIVVALRGFVIASDRTNMSGCSGTEPGAPLFRIKILPSSMCESLAMSTNTRCQKLYEKLSTCEICRMMDFNVCGGGTKLLSMRAIDGQSSTSGLIGFLARIGPSSV
jgi:hypothetical protein